MNSLILEDIFPSPFSLLRPPQPVSVTNGLVDIGIHVTTAGSSWASWIVTDRTDADE